MARLSDITLILFFSRGYSLADWQAGGIMLRDAGPYLALAPHLKEVVFVTYGGATDRRLAQRLEPIRVVSNRLGLREAWHAAVMSRLWPRLWRGPAVVRTNQMAGASVALAAARAAGSPLVARCGYLGSFIMEQRFGANSAQARAAWAEESEAFAAAAKAVVCTEVIRERVIESYRLDPGRVVVIPNYVDLELFRPNPAAAPAPKRLICVGRLHPEKNLAALIESLAGLDVELVLVGDGDIGDDLKTLAESLGVRAEFMGNRPNAELPALLNSAAAFVMPSLYEGHPKSLVEAMACGRPVIGSDVTGVREMIEHGVTGLLCPPDPAGLRQVVERVLASPGRAAEMGRAARRFAEQRFSLDTVVGKELAVLEEVAAHA